LRYRAYSNEDIRNLDPAVCPFSHVTVMYKKDEVIRAGGYDNHAHSFEDHLLWLKLIPMGKVCNFPQSSVKVRFNPGSVTIDEKWRGKEFSKLKYTCLRKRLVTTEECERLQHIIQKQNSDKIKMGSYYSLIAKKYLWDNHDPVKARRSLVKLMGYYPAKPEIYFLYLVSFLPRNVISLIYRNRPNRN